MNLWIPFLDNVNRLFQYRFCFSQVDAGKVVSVVYLTAVATSIPLGLYVDAYGQRRLLTAVGLAVFLLAQAIILVYPQCPEDGGSELGAIAGLVFEGIGYSFYANVFVSSIPLVTKAKLLGTAFGIMEMLESFFEFVIPLITGSIVGSSSSTSLGYRFSSLFFVVIGLAGFGIGLMLFFSISEHNKHKLDRSSR
jgi:MFS family permease